jgi:hypothetical protein
MSSDYELHHHTFAVHANGIAFAYLNTALHTSYSRQEAFPTPPAAWHRDRLAHKFQRQFIHWSRESSRSLRPMTAEDGGRVRSSMIAHPE